MELDTRDESARDLEKTNYDYDSHEHKTEVQVLISTNCAPCGYFRQLPTYLHRIPEFHVISEINFGNTRCATAPIYAFMEVPWRVNFVFMRAI